MFNTLGGSWSLSERVISNKLKKSNLCRGGQTEIIVVKISIENDVMKYLFIV